MCKRAALTCISHMRRNHPEFQVFRNVSEGRDALKSKGFGVEKAEKVKVFGVKKRVLEMKIPSGAQAPLILRASRGGVALEAGTGCGKTQNMTV